MGAPDEKKPRENREIEGDFHEETIRGLEVHTLKTDLRTVQRNNVDRRSTTTALTTDNRSVQTTGEGT